MLVTWEPGELGRLGAVRYAAIGAFDGVHAAHRTLIARAVADARRDGAVPAVVTFEPNPKLVLHPQAAPPPLSALEERLEAFRSLGVEAALVLRFDERLARMPAEDFVRDVLCGAARLARSYVGYNFTFGHGGRGRPEHLAAWGAACGMAVVVLEPQTVADPRTGEPRPVSSSAVREALAAGDVRLAARLLGRPYSVRGPVVHGDGRGRALGYPTANVALPPRRAMPPPGVYAGAAREPGGPWRAAAVSWGRRPTFGGGEPVLEAHLLDFAGDLYGATLEVAFLERLRDELAFPDVEALKMQMARDVDAAREVFRDGPLV
ncbi:MAG: bifunctional riboflavin kinase/FAD synthetase [Firmicutes bacterium]|nr:bifunctional riboflavin kinase/FAD synthetase [Bacillota bacterium]